MLRGLSLLLGRQRDLVRRVGALALVWMGVHAGADVLDDAAASALDAADLVVDHAFAAAVDSVTAGGALSPEAAARAIEAASGLVDIDEKQWLGLRIALIVELWIMVALLPLCWGQRGLIGPTRRDELRRSAVQLRAAYASLDLERIVAPPVLAVAATSGAVGAGVALEQLVHGALAAQVPGFLGASSAGAAVGVVVAAVLLARFLPDLLHGAVRRSQARGDDDRAARAARRARAPRAPAVRGRLHDGVDALGRALRGGWLLPVLFVVVGGLQAADVGALWQRLQGGP
jgi:hypothetical protein